MLPMRPRLFGRAERLAPLHQPYPLPEFGGPTPPPELMHFENSSGGSAVLVPAGHSTIARRFNAGFPATLEQVPEGRLMATAVELRTVACLLLLLLLFILLPNSLARVRLRVRARARLCRPESDFNRDSTAVGPARRPPCESTQLQCTS